MRTSQWLSLSFQLSQVCPCLSLRFELTYGSYWGCPAALNKWCVSLWLSMRSQLSQMYVFFWLTVSSNEPGFLMDVRLSSELSQMCLCFSVVEKCQVICWCLR